MFILYIYVSKTLYRTVCSKPCKVFFVGHLIDFNHDFDGKIYFPYLIMLAPNLWFVFTIQNGYTCTHSVFPGQPTNICGLFSLPSLCACGSSQVTTFFLPSNHSHFTYLNTMRLLAATLISPGLSHLWISPFILHRKYNYVIRHDGIIYYCFMYKSFPLN